MNKQLIVIRLLRRTFFKFGVDGFERLVLALFLAGFTMSTYADDLVSKFREAHKQPSIELVRERPIRIQQGDFSGRQLALQRTRCRGKCPEYYLSVHGDGTVEYEGFRNVSLIGHHTGMIDYFHFDVIFEYAEKDWIWDLEDGYFYGIPDLQTTFVFVKIGAREKIIRNQGRSAPVELMVLEELIDGLLEKVEWDK